MTNLKNVPGLRFPGFEGEWEAKKLGEISTGVMYGMNSAAIPFDGVNKYLRITDIDEDSRTFLPNPLSSPDGEIDDKYKLGEGDIVFTRTGASTGKSYLYKKSDGNLLFAGFLIKFSIKKANPYFIYAFTFKSSYHRWVQVMSMRSGQPGINAEEYKLLKVNLPTLPEQQKIAAFLTAIDTRIQQLTRKKALLEQYKKGVMQRIFSREIRFKDEEGREYAEWEEKKAGDVFKNQSNRNHKGDLPILAITQDLGVVRRDSLDKEIQSSDASVLSYKIIEPGDFVISLRSFQGGIEYSSVLGISSPAYTVLKPKIPIGELFFKYYFKKESFISQLSNTVVGIREGKQISYEAFSGLNLPIPSFPEQQKIAAFLTAIDAKINQVGEQINHTRNYKKGLLQQMFV